MKKSISILNSKDRYEEIKKLNNLDIDYIHIDLMDGIFVSQKNYTTEEIKLLNSISNKKMDVHLMVEDPISYINKLDNLNIEYITFHLEVNNDIDKIIDVIKNKGYKVGLSIKPNTEVDKLLPYLDKIDLVLIMSVEPGLGGQTFLPKTYDKIIRLNQLVKKSNLSVEIEVDGGINDTNYNKLKELNVDISVIGTYLIGTDNFIDRLKKLN